MKVAYLIVAHHNYDHLRRLLNVLKNDEVRIYVHIDAKVKMPDIDKEGVHFVTREDVYWGGFSQVKATLHLLKAAFADGADYYILLSGVDFPVRSFSDLKKELSNGYEFINLFEGPTITKPISRFDRYYFELENRRSTGIKNKLVRGSEKLLHLFAKRSIPFKLYVGSNWFALSRNAIGYILKVIQEDKRYEKLFKWSLCPDEAFFQTILGNSPFKEKCRHNLTYADWSVPCPPAIITKEHIEKLKGKVEDGYGVFEPYFARKFNDQSSEVVARIKMELLNNPV